ncbi:MAG: hypothetical protein JWN66_46 [Sphingomonas bacterium]|nr:hypothetical protein [Sphingomonas bacterium]
MRLPAKFWLYVALGLARILLSLFSLPFTRARTNSRGPRNRGTAYLVPRSDGTVRF